VSPNLSYSSAKSFGIEQLWGVVAAMHGFSVESGVAFLPGPSAAVSVSRLSFYRWHYHNYAPPVRLALTIRLWETQ